MTEDITSSTHPPLPPTTEEARFDWLRLLRSRRVGPVTFHRLLREHGSASAALQALPDVALAAGVQNYQICPEAVIAAEIASARAARARLICFGDPDYPETLKALDDAPPILWALGDATLLAKPLIAIVGARNASSLGTRTARKFSTDLSDAGFVVVSGLARGIDAVAHDAALNQGTIAVQAGGVDVIYPAENTRLAHDIAAKGLRLSEQPMGLHPQARHFPARNRIIAGLGKALVVVEAAARSGSLITAEAANAYGRDVFAVPGHPFDGRAAGCNRLIRDGAMLVRGAEDIISALASPDRAVATSGVSKTPGTGAPAAPDRKLPEIAKLHQEILRRLGPSPLAEDQLIRDLGASSARVAPALVDLELDGHITRHAGGLLARAN